MSLKEYRRKRKFQATPEPRGKKQRKRSTQFVVHFHSASRLHYDLRLEIDGVYKSWAVPKGPSLNPLDQRLAIFVEDHPLEYGKFEGTIPKGNYGAGTVMIWDRGTYEPRSKKDLSIGLDEGHLTFILNGKKLRGEFALIKLKKGEQNAWLLVKKRDEFSSYQAITLENRSVHSGRTMEEITAAASTKKNTWIRQQKKKPIKLTKLSKKEALPRRIRPMLFTFAEAVPTGDWIREPFRNGYRVIAEVDHANVQLYSKFLLPSNVKFPNIVSALRRLNTTLILDGEIAGSLFFVFDVLYAEGRDLRSRPLSERKKILKKLAIFGEWIRANENDKTEKVLARQPNSKYESGISANAVVISPLKKNAVQKFTHLDKIYFPKERYTKSDLIEYYRSVSQIILPYLIDRPQSLHRHPNGINHSSFFHKDMKEYLPSFVQTTRIHSSSSEKTTNYLLCQNEATLLFLANYGCIELNPWISRIPHLDHPDYVVIDLDPDGNKFDDVITVAQEVHRFLEKIGAKSWCKTSGATGLHICIPTQGAFDFDTGRNFAELVCKSVHERFPKMTSVERNPAKRRKKIYLDFLQNRRGQTLAAPYCVRPLPGAPVSTPLEWKEVKKGLDPKDFTMKNILLRIRKKGDFWKPMLIEKVDIEGCLRKLGAK